MFAAQRIAQIVENCQSLVREESLSGQEGGVVRAIEAMMRSYGFDEINIDRYGNIVGSRPGKTVVFDGHIDTVPYKWTRAARRRGRRRAHLRARYHRHEGFGVGDDLCRRFLRRGQAARLRAQDLDRLRGA